MNLFLTALFVGMIAYQTYDLVRYRRPYRIAFLAFWALLLFAHIDRREDLYPVIFCTLVVAVIWRKREPVAFARIMKREMAKQPKSAPARSELWDKDLDSF